MSITYKQMVERYKTHWFSQTVREPELKKLYEELKRNEDLLQQLLKDGEDFKIFEERVLLAMACLGTLLPLDKVVKFVRQDPLLYIVGVLLTFQRAHNDQMENTSLEQPMLTMLIGNMCINSSPADPMRVLDEMVDNLGVPDGDEIKKELTILPQTIH